MATVTTTAGKPIDDNQFPITPRVHGSGLPRAYQPIERLARRNRAGIVERVVKTIRKIAIASAVAFSAFALTVTPGSAARVGRSMTPPQQYCMYYDEGGTDCSFISYAQCWATASGQAGGCYANSPSDDEGFRGAEFLWAAGSCANSVGGVRS